MKNYVELQKNYECPCGSGKKYGDCCRKKGFKFVREENQIIKQVPMNKEVEILFSELQRVFKEYYGRDCGQNDYVAAFAPIYNDRMLLEAIDLFRESNFPENKIYAYYKSNGLFPCDENIELLSEKDIEVFESLCNTYDEQMEATMDSGVSIIQFVAFANSFIEEQLEYTVTALISCMNNFIRRHSNENNIRQMKIEKEIDYCIFSALKTIKTLESVNKLRKEHLPECIYSLGRSIFENYIYMVNINRDTQMFKEKIVPKVDDERYVFETYTNGKINYNKVIEKATGKSINLKNNVKNLAENLPYETDKELYTLFYEVACQYVQVDVMSAKSYFSIYDPYDEIDPSLIAGLIIAILSMILLVQISENSEVELQYKKDVSFLYGNLSERLKNSLEVAKCDPEHSNAIYDLLIRRLNEK